MKSAGGDAVMGGGRVVDESAAVLKGEVVRVVVVVWMSWRRWCRERWRGEGSALEAAAAIRYQLAAKRVGPVRAKLFLRYWLLQCFSSNSRGYIHFVVFGCNLSSFK